MASAKDILDERLARGEITVDEHGKLAAQISPQPAREHSAPPPKAQSALPKPSALWGYGGLGVAVFLVIIFASVSRQAVSDCISSGAGNIAFCQQNGVNWPFIYIMYALAALCAFSGISHLVRLRK